MSRDGSPTLRDDRYLVAVPRLPGAVCVGHHHLPWDEDGNPAEELADPNVRAAINLCCACPARRPCLSHALRVEEVGIWGGLTAHQRRRLTQPQRTP